MNVTEDNQNISSTLQISSCIDGPIWFGILVFFVYISTMLLSLLGNIVSLIIFLHRPSHYRQSTNSAFYSSLRTRSTRVTRSAEDEQPEIASRRIVAKQDCDHRRGMVTRVNFALPHYSGCSPSSFNHYLASLAVSDLLMAIFCIPFTFTQICLGYWPFNYLLCPMVVYAQLVMVTASSLTNTAISLNRLVGVINPMRRKRWNTDSFFCRTSCRLVFIWGVALVGSSVQLVVTRVHTELGLSVCQEAWFGDVQSRGIYTVVLFLVIYAGPLGVQGATYGFISYRLWRRATPGERIRSMEDARLKEKKRIIKMLTCIVLMFGICWLPSHVYFLLQDFFGLDEYMEVNTGRIIFGVCNWIAMSNSFVNPLIYLSMSKNFKKEFRLLLQCIFPCRQKSSGNKSDPKYTNSGGKQTEAEAPAN